MINIKLENKVMSVGMGTTLQEFLRQQGYTQEYIAVAVNSQHILRQHYSNTVLQHQDTVDIITPMQGG